ncbi:alanine racemase [Arsenicicoccus bolidensis]|uniref:alanine racemase n=1 Tax=Arsenicicoccus bolidensis TaxID=229480 RepID=UPI000427EF99|nr:alanine racemase [Arsenicicoccus bolidensis]
MLYATHAEVDLSAIRANIEGIREQVRDRTILVAVKADAYGHGAVAVSRMIQATGVADWLGIATVPEALELRAASITMPILKLSHCFPGAEMEAAIAADVVTACPSRECADALQAAAEQVGRPARVHLKVDTGMARIGVPAGEAAALAAYVEGLGSVSLEGIFTHMPVADTASQDAFTEEQVALFARTVEEVQATLGRCLEHVHAANSGGVLGHSSSWLTMVRPGIMVYGYYPDASTPRTIALRQAIRWVTRVSFVKRVPAGTTVGYGRTWSADEDRWVATMPVGYADGYNRLLSNRGRVLVGGQSHPIAGRVCMDQTMIDAGPASEPCPVSVGDEAVLLGTSGAQEITTDEMAELLGTITYEVTCDIARRVERTYRDG